jgi:fatty acid kinase fatty acid binding subunit
MVKIITDTTACLPDDVARRYQIPIIPQVINFENDSYYEGIQMDNAAFMQRLRSSSLLPKTAAPPPELFVEVFQRLVPSGEAILCIHPSAEISGTVRSASVACMDFPDADIRIIDTRTVASPLGTLVTLAAGWAAEGLDADTITARVEAMARRCRLYFLVATLEYLARGGRIGGASALLGSVLQIKPILTLREGRVGQYERERTQRRAVIRLKEIVCEQYPRNDEGYLSVLHAGVPDEGLALALDLKELLRLNDVPLFDMPPAIVTHGGPGILGVAFFTEEARP